MPEKFTNFVSNFLVGAGGLYLQHPLDKIILLQSTWSEHSLKPEGRPYFRKIEKKIAAGEYVGPSEFMQALKGFNYAEAADNLYDFGQINTKKGALILANHSDEGPLNGYGQVAVLSYYFNAFTDREIRWVQGKGSSFVDRIHKHLGKSVNTIYIDNRETDESGYIKDRSFWFVPGRMPERASLEGTRELLQSLRNNEFPGIFPEATQSKSMQKLNPLAAGPIDFAARRDMQIVCVSSSFANDTFNFSMKILDNAKIRQIAATSSTPKQDIVDYAGLTIASGLPPDRQGHYREMLELRKMLEQRETTESFPVFSSAEHIKVKI